MKKISSSFFVFSLAICFCYAQEEILAEGKITDSRTNKGVKANVGIAVFPREVSSVALVIVLFLFRFLVRPNIRLPQKQRVIIREQLS